MASFAVLVGEPTGINRRDLNSGKSVTNFRIDGVDCTAWEEVGAAITGGRIIATGRIQNRSYKKKDGGTGYITEVVVSNVQPIDGGDEPDLLDI